MSDGSALLPMFRIHSELNVFEVMPHSKNETGTYKVVLSAFEKSTGKSDLYYEEVI